MSAQTLGTNILIVAFLLLGFEGGSVSNSSELANAESHSKNCYSFEGIFRAYGRRKPQFEIKAPLPNRAPGNIRSTNEALVSQFLGCHPACVDGLNPQYTSFAIQFHSSTLRWAALHSTSGDIVYHGKKVVNCKDGELFYSSKATAPFSADLPQTLVNVEDLRFAIINNKGWLVGYRKHDLNGTASIVFPTVDSRSDAWVEFPPDPNIRIDTKILFGSLPKIVELEVAKVGDPNANMYQKRMERLAPHKMLLVNDGTKTTEETIDGISLLLVSVDQKKREDGFYDIYADVRARRGEEEQMIRLERDYSGLDLKYKQVFDREIALEIIYQQMGSITILRPERARILVRKR